jgi:hypothetical protein
MQCAGVGQRHRAGAALGSWRRRSRARSVAGASLVAKGLVGARSAQNTKALARQVRGFYRLPPMSGARGTTSSSASRTWSSVVSVLLLVHLSSLVEPRSRACSVDNAEVGLEHDRRAVDSCIAWLSERLAAGAALTAQIRPIRQRRSSRPRCWRSGRACACIPASVRQAGGLNVTVPRWRTGTVYASAAGSSGIRPKRYDVLSGIELAPAPPSAVNQGSDPIDRDGPTTDGAAGLATGEQEVCGDAQGETRFLAGASRHDVVLLILGPAVSS